MAAGKSTNGSVLTNGAPPNGDAAGDTLAAVTQAQTISAGKQPIRAPNVEITDDSWCPDEIALYDRQIRLWGVKAQERSLAIRLFYKSQVSGLMFGSLGYGRPRYS